MYVHPKELNARIISIEISKSYHETCGTANKKYGKKETKKNQSAHFIYDSFHFFLLYSYTANAAAARYCYI